jgi:molecular chaperone DnaK (HSP70)
MDEVHVGIDLGTTTTLIARAIEGEHSIAVRVLPIRQQDGYGGTVELNYLPSVAYFPESGPCLVGLEAQVRGPQENAGRYIRAIKRQMGRRLILPAVNQEPHQVAALYLQHALHEARHHLPLGEMVSTVTVPASFTTNQRADTLRALQLACQEARIPYPHNGEGELFISEPVAATLAFLNKELERPESIRRLDFSKDNRVVVYDIGGGTLDLTLVFIPQQQNVKTLADLEVHVDAIGYYNPFGGEDFDLELAKELHRRLLDQFPELRDLHLTSLERLGVRLQLMNAAKPIKEHLSDQMDPHVETGLFDDAEEPSHFYHEQLRILSDTYALEGEVTVSEYRQVVATLLTGTSRKSLITPLKDLLDKTGFDSGRLDGLLIVGGMGRLPLVGETLRTYWGNDKVWVLNQPDHAVVTGAAIYSYLRRRYPGFRLEEPAADAYYVRLKDKFDPILPAKAKLGQVKRYELDQDADRVLLQVFAGEEPEPGESVESIYTSLIYQGGTTVKLGRKCPKGTPVWIQMRYEGETGHDHSKVPWVYVWLESQEQAPFRYRYSDMIEEVYRD